MRKRLQAVPVLILLGLFGASLADCQQTARGPLASDDADIPNAPSTIVATKCTENNGKACPEWVPN